MMSSLMPKIPDHFLGGGPEGFLFSNFLVSRSMMLKAVTIRSPGSEKRNFSRVDGM
jgi:hypothetical protein